MTQWMAARSAWRTWWPAVVGAVAVAGPVFLVGQCSGAQHERDKQAGSSVTVVARDGAAKESAAGERAVDKSRIAGNQQEQTDAVHSKPDQAPSAGRRSRACVQLRQQGTPADRLPAGC